METTITLKNGKTKTYRNFGSAYNFFMKEYHNIETTNKETLNKILEKKESNYQR